GVGPIARQFAVAAAVFAVLSACGAGPASHGGVPAILSQRGATGQIVASGCDYVLAVKDNQPTLHEDVHQLFMAGLENNFAGREHRSCRTAGRGHGRTEVRHYHLVKVPETLARKHVAFAGLRTVGMVFSERQVGDGPATAETRFYISSLHLKVRAFASLLWSESPG